MKKATIHDYVRFCDAHTKCLGCSLENMSLCKNSMRNVDIDKANKIILDWCDQNPAKTRQSEFLKHYPNANFLPTSDGVVLAICPKELDVDYKNKYYPSTKSLCKMDECLKCKQEFWFTEI